MQQQSADQRHHRKQRQEPAQERLPERLFRVQERRAAHRVARRMKNHEQLHELGRLQVDEPERQPALAAVDRSPDAGDEHRDEQCTADDEQIRRERLPGLHRDLKRDQACRKARDDEQRMTGEEIPRTIARVGGGLRDRDRRRIHHHHPDRKQQQRGPGERRVVDQHGAALPWRSGDRREARQRRKEAVSRHA